MQKFFRVVFILIFLFAFGFVSAKLFFEPQLRALLERFTFTKSSGDSRELTIGVAEPLTDLDPTTDNAASRERLFNIYEGLTKLDKNLNVIPALAVTFGATDDLTWEFRLRPNVLFHDGSKLEMDDVISSLDKEKDPNVIEISKIDEFRLSVKTKTPDPLLLQKMASYVVFKEKNIGTGPYIFDLKNENEFKIKQFENYWGEKPTFSSVKYVTLETRDKRKEAFEKGAVDILTDFPPELFALNTSSTMKAITAPTLESNFLLFGMDGIFKNKNLRIAAQIAFDRKEVAKLAFGFAKPINQFAAPGIFGFDPGIEPAGVDTESALEIVSRETGGQRVSANFYLPKGLNALGDFLKGRFRQIGIDLDVHLVSEDELFERVQKQDADLIFFGWRMDLGDTSEFFTQVIHSRKEQFGSFNAGGFSNKEIDTQIEETQKIIKPLERLKKLRVIMKMVTEDEIVGIPLFSPEALYAVSPGISFSPRIDGYVFAGEIQGK